MDLLAFGEIAPTTTNQAEKPGRLEFDKKNHPL